MREEAEEDERRRRAAKEAANQQVRGISLWIADRLFPSTRH